jgi:hypothetical protein
MARNVANKRSIFSDSYLVSVRQLAESSEFFTTFSTFSLENLQFIQNGKFALAACYTATSFLLGILAVWAGFKLLN